MTGLTLEEKLAGAETRARQHTAEKHFFEAAQPFFPLGFSIGRRNPGHWDVYANRCPGYASAWQAAHPEGSTSATDNDRERAFRIRGGPGDVQVIDERWNPTNPHPREWMKFRSITAAMVWICEELMQEPSA
ncbi:hypothetical protein HAP47_0022225 [Bradyrhizobium sp. 41S5]|uniref:hypothetical protein n=1 Tax=Bradyrhizobium sp. 41S5 TaxID=1404443 RepID=UPI00156AFED6|nr:hypothetical protein [Bradyrhizobium sp. 41S5]UFX42011.1 hypothetical protein HAP47_0022225 [Bradyrhizobium sp. 41S5]